MSDTIILIIVLMAHMVGFFQRLTRPGMDFPLTVRIYHSVLLICIAALLYNVPLNLYVGLPWIALASAVTLALVIFLYYLSRYTHYTTISRFIFCLLGNSLFLVNFFLNSGIDGPTGYFFLVLLVVMVAIVPINEYWYWVGSNLALVFSLHFLQYHHPKWVPPTYSTPADRYIDISSAYLTVVVIVLACFYITRRRYEAERLEAQRTAAQLAELDAEKNKLFSIISHDLRSPLALIQNYLELLAQIDLTESERMEIKAQLLQSTRGTLDLVNNVLHWSKSQMSGDALRKEQLPLKALLTTQLELFKTIAVQKQIQLEIVIPQGVIAWGNAEMVQLIVRNLVNNAIKFTATGGSILISASQDLRTTLVAVKDSGDGKPAQLTNDIFQLSSAPTKGTGNESGVGLGLSLCRDYVQLLGGRIWFTCDPESGTTFFVELPLG